LRYFQAPPITMRPDRFWSSSAISAARGAGAAVNELIDRVISTALFAISA
jgi:hypothetical protein